MRTGKRIFVGLSGGVDSSVAALRLKQAGHDVVGVFIKVWQPEWLACNWEAERLDAMRVAAALDIPFLTCDAESVYRDDVADYFIREYRAGRTPNPDVMCNKHVKFGAFMQFALEHGADAIATGHYARVMEGREGPELWRGVDTAKDQSYFLWTLSPEILERVHFPVGDTPKERIRQEAAGAGLPTATKKDSQGICFLGHVDIPEFLRHYTELIPGPVLNKDGLVIGQHQGALVYTIGQRHGFTIKAASPRTAPHYVTGRDLAQNTITVDETPPIVKNGTVLELSECNWITALPKQGMNFTVTTRYRQDPRPASLIEARHTTARLTLLEAGEVPTPGQSCVFYDHERCLGGGIIA